MEKLQVSPEMAHYKEWFQTHREAILKDYIKFLSFPSVSAQATHKNDMIACLTWLEERLKKMGFTVSRIEGKGHPILFAERKGSPDKKTVLLYGHYDVQPPEPLELWKSEPFKPEIREGRVFARGAEDNKGQCFYTICAVEAFLESHKELNIKFVIEGEEEMGSVSLLEALPKQGEKLKADYLLVVDVGMGSWEKPSITLGCRGVMTMEIQCTSLSTDVHSGHYGGIIYNPIRALTEALAQVIDHDGKVQIPGFYDHIVTLSDEEKKKVDLAFDPKIHQKEVGAVAFHYEKGYNPTEVSFLRPVFEINGIKGGYAGEGFKTVLPKEAVAKLSCRLVPNQDPEKIYDALVTFLRARIPKEMHVECRYHGGGPACWSDPSSPLIKIVEKAYRDLFGTCYCIYAGGSVPITSALAKAANAEAIMMGTALDCDNIHAPNENFGLDQFEVGFLLIIKTLEQML